MQNEIIIDPFLDLISTLTTDNKKIHIRIKQRNGRKCNTHIEQLPSDIKLAKLLKKMRQSFHCNGSVQKTGIGEYIQLFGDQRSSVKKFLIDNSIAEKQNIVIHGY